MHMNHSSSLLNFFLRRPVSLCHGLLSVVHLAGRLACRSCVRPLTFSLNIFFSETTYRILMNFTEMFLPWSSSEFLEKNLIPSKTVVAMVTKLKKI